MKITFALLSALFVSNSAFAQMPAEHSMLVMGGFELSNTKPKAGFGLSACVEFYVTDWLSMRTFVTVPVNNSLLPILAGGSGGVHLWPSEMIDPYLVGMGGMEINRNPSASEGTQPFLEVGAGVQFNMPHSIVLRAELAHHFSNIPQTNAPAVNNNYLFAQTAVGVLFP